MAAGAELEPGEAADPALRPLPPPPRHRRHLAPQRARARRRGHRRLQVSGHTWCRVYSQCTKCPDIMVSRSAMDPMSAIAELSLMQNRCLQGEAEQAKVSCLHCIMYLTSGCCRCDTPARRTLTAAGPNPSPGRGPVPWSASPAPPPSPPPRPAPRPAW